MIKCCEIVDSRREKEMMKCMECSYQTDNRKQRFCPYDGSELIESEETVDVPSELVELDEEY